MERAALEAEVYRNALAREVRGLGYEIENRRDTKGQDLGFEIQGVSQGLMATYSQRSQQRDEAIEEFALRHGRQPTDNEIAILVRESRPEQAARDLDGRTQTPALEHASPALQYAQQHVFERVSVAREHELLTEALRHSRGRFELAEVMGCCQSRRWIFEGSVTLEGGRKAE